MDTINRWGYCGLCMQYPPVSITPTMSLAAIFYLMNTMALELVPVLSAGGVYHGLVTRASIIRYQKRQGLDETALFARRGSWLESWRTFRRRLFSAP